jgi:hypothetical protein
MIDPETVKETGPAPLVDAEGPIPTFPRRTVDPALGAVPPLSEEEQAARASAVGRAMKVIASITDETDTDERWAEIMRDLDACRPHRKLFEGMY